jgi:hypothetical protein
MCGTNLNTVAINKLPGRLMSHGSAMSNTMRQVVSAIVAAILMSVLAILCQSNVPPAQQIPGAQTVFGIMAIAGAVIFVISLFVLNNDTYQDTVAKQKTA